MFKNIIILLIFILLLNCSKKNNPAEIEKQKKWIISENGLILRTGPSKDTEKILTINYGSEIDIIEESKIYEKINSINANWIKVNYQGKTGWVFGGYLSGIKPSDNLESFISGKTWIQLDEEILNGEATYNFFAGIWFDGFQLDGKYSGGVDSGGEGIVGTWEVNGNSIIINGNFSSDSGYSSDTTININVININKDKAEVEINGKRCKLFRYYIFIIDDIVKNNDLDVLKYYINNNGGVKNLLYGKLTYLHFTSYNGNIIFSRYLLDQGISINSVNINNDTPLHFAVANNQIEMVKFLIDNDADTKIINSNNHTALDIAEGKNYNEIVEILKSHE